MRFQFHPAADAELDQAVDENLHIIAVANLRMRPDYWKERIAPNHRIESDEP